MSIDYHIRWMLEMDMDRIVEIEKDCFPDPWTKKEFMKTLRHRSNIGMTIESYENDDNGEVVGYMVYTLKKTCLDILNFAVCPCRQRSGFGTALVEKLISKLVTTSRASRNRLETTIGESNMSALQFFKAMGFVATRVERDYYETRDAIIMQYFNNSDVKKIVSNRLLEHWNGND